ncbi:uncharacterized protein B0I36DRAFT_358475 [Microdochium trichocladiopsis]|uniref:Fucose-specific lectin n=1 Tax=Microdochium trichocladiopsis TaxID=1682393 RepID=A0A9P9BUS8_9PEZI|nr:uncharacterized protein B0I36DRAFT_358475 [Microdochium trichocladiopsis]KAH7041291.1 hypothetical protein B0I36DRAFT_358475 [Microdochium trichocladiopsis]
MVVNYEQGYQYADYPQVYDDASGKEAFRPQHASEMYPEAVTGNSYLGDGAKPGMAVGVMAGGPTPPPPGYAELGDAHARGNELGSVPTPGTATICGLRRRNFWIALVVAAAVVIAAVVGGVVGGVVSKKTGSDGNTASGGQPQPVPKPSGTNSSFLAVLTGTKIAASNWTGPEGFGRRAVFFQDEHNSIVARLWDSQNGTWLTHNISDILASRKIDVAIAPAKSLASAALDSVNAFGPRLWYVGTDNIVRRVESAELNVAQSPDSWTADLPNGNSFNHTIWPDSQLAAAWQRCAPNCVGDWILAYQRNTDGAIMTANNSHWDNPDQAMGTGSVSKSTALAIVPWYQVVARGMGLVSESMAGTGRADMQLYSFNTNTGKWADTGKPLLESVIPSASSETQFAVTKWDGWRQTLYLSLTSDGKLSASWWTGPQTAIQEITMTGFTSAGTSSAPQFTAMTLTLDAMFYGVTADGLVLEYAVDQDDPRTFRYVSTIWPPA